MEESYYIEYDITLTREEAKHGCVRTIRPEDAACPLNVTLRPGLKDGTVLRIGNVPVILDDGSRTGMTLLLTVYVERKSHKRLIAVILIVALLASLFGYAASRYAPLISNVIDTTVQTLPTLALPSPSAEDTAAASSSVQETPAQPSDAAERSGAEFAASVIPYFELRWYLNNMEDRLLYNLCTMYTAMYCHADSCDFEQPMTADELAFLNHMLFLECPELLLDSSRHYTYSLDQTGNIISTTFEYSYSADEYYSRREACQSIINNVAASLEGLSEYEKELSAYNYICGSCTYDKDSSDAGNAYGAFVNASAKCDGLSLAMKWLCEEMGISCLMADGYDNADGDGHAWNIIRIDGVYSTLNITDDVSVTAFQKEQGAYSYSVFDSEQSMMLSLYELSDMITSHFTLPATDDFHNCYAVRNGYYISAGFPYEEYLYSRMRQTLSEGGGYVRLQFESQADYEYYRDELESILANYPATYEEAEYQISCYTYDSYRFLGLLFYK